VVTLPGLADDAQHRPGVHQRDRDAREAQTGTHDGIDIDGLDVHPDHTRPWPSAGARLAPRSAAERPCRTVMGFLPYWVSPAGVVWNDLTHVACFDVRLNADGTVVNPISWPWTSTIAAARAANVKVLLTLTGFDPVVNSNVVNSPAARASLAAGLANLIRNNADGIVLDLEGVNPAPPLPPWQNRMTELVIDLRARMRVLLAGSAFPEPLIYVATPAWNWAGGVNGWNFASLAVASDGLFVMGYDYTGSWSAAAGASAPLTGNSGINVTATVNTQYAAAIQAAGGKIVLGVPYYGNQWRTAGSNAGSASQGHAGSVLYSTAQTQQSVHGRQWDASTQTPWYRFQNGSQWNQVWYDDAQSIRAKFRLAKSAGLGGAGMWALTYDGSRTELSAVIRDEFVLPCPCRADFNFNGSVTIDDLFIYLNAWFIPCRGDLATQAGAPCLGRTCDVSGDGDVDLDDLFVYLNRWFAGC
jgi:spore germination protein YaaH